MSIFNICETCGDIAEAVCACSSTPRFFCDAHATDHRKSGGSHPFREAFLPLSSEQVSFLQQAFDQYRKESIRNVILRKNKRIEDLLKQIRKVEDDCSREIESLLAERSTIEQVCAFGSLPVVCSSPLVSSLASLRASSTFSYPEILKELFSFRSTLPPLSCTLKSPRWELSQQFQGHHEQIRSLAVSDCERYLASASVDKTIKIWDLESIECVHTLFGHTNAVNSVAFWGSKVVSGSVDNTIKIWEGSMCLDILNLHSDWVMNLSISSCKRLLVSGGYDKKVIVYSLEEKKTLHSLLHSRSVCSVVFSPSDEKVVSGGEDGSIKVWNTDTGELLKSLNRHSNGITCLCFWENFLVSSSNDSTIKIWDLEKDKEEIVRTLTGHSSYVVRVEASENILCSLGQDNSIKLWDKRTQKCFQTLEGHGDYSLYEIWLSMGLKFLKKADSIISGGRDKNIKIFKRVS